MYNCRVKDLLVSFLKILICRKVFALIFSIFFLISCTNVTTSISGEIVHRRDKANTYSEPFNFTPDSYAVITVKQIIDKETEIILKIKRIERITQFPIPFKVDFAEKINFGKEGVEYSVGIQIFSQAGSLVRVGDLVTEMDIHLGKSFVKIEVTGLEDCTASYSQGACSNLKD